MFVIVYCYSYGYCYYDLEHFIVNRKSIVRSDISCLHLPYLQ